MLRTPNLTTSSAPLTSPASNSCETSPPFALWGVDKELASVLILPNVRIIHIRRHRYRQRAWLRGDIHHLLDSWCHQQANLEVLILRWDTEDLPTPRVSRALDLGGHLNPGPHGGEGL